MMSMGLCWEEVSSLEARELTNTYRDSWAVSRAYLRSRTVDSNGVLLHGGMISRRYGMAPCMGV